MVPAASFDAKLGVSLGAVGPPGSGRARAPGAHKEGDLARVPTANHAPSHGPVKHDHVAAERRGAGLNQAGCAR